MSPGHRGRQANQVKILALCLLTASLVAAPNAGAKKHTFPSVAIIPASGPKGSTDFEYVVFIGYTGPKYPNPSTFQAGDKTPPRSGTCAHSRRYHLFSVKGDVTTEVTSGVTKQRKTLTPFSGGRTEDGTGDHDYSVELPTTGAYLEQRIIVPVAAVLVMAPTPETFAYVTLDKRVIKKKGKVVATCKSVVGPLYANGLFYGPGTGP